MNGNSYLNCSDDGFRHHLQEEHRQLNEELDELNACCLGQRNCDVQADWNKLRDRVHRLKDNIVHHFREEEEGSCLDEAVARRPTLAAEAREIEQEHPELLAELDGLISWLDQEPAMEATLQNAKQRLNSFADNLRRHEWREDALIRRGVGAFGVDD
ncbi:hemerythrin domain-containing protein [Blastopirellula sp. JC732]|uniref:Hemerythrin domain-containing protein n=1 Tax=Blastopirellula sediminis TaxID=2894196 RepID=A0A9X1MN14_9BACT|nr:hemerythrin domain-containing protein [Blastopirellula sediminis]MCC9607452.1 hemerythrin domain-containing protein [Blastopirellula sediminis]MCC9629255.1 hemerythrin domain-containing protein [Blastopirellula sediminis]